MRWNRSQLTATLIIFVGISGCTSTSHSTDEGHFFTRLWSRGDETCEEEETPAPKPLRRDLKLPYTD